MKAYCIFLFIVFYAHPSIGQFFTEKRGEDLYNKGSEYIRNGDYKSADSLLTLALKTFRNENVYFNRGIARLFLNDSIGMCDDMSAASNEYGDTEAEKYFLDYCCKRVDSIFYDEKFEITVSMMNNFKYVEVVKQLKYNDQTIGTIYDLKNENNLIVADMGSDSKRSVIGFRKGNLIGKYYLINDVKFFMVSEKYAFISSNELPKYDDVQTRIANLLDSKYKYLKKSNGTDQFRVRCMLLISDKVEIISVKCIGISPEIRLLDKVHERELIGDVEQNVKYYPKYSPGKFNGEKVNYIVFDSLTF